MTKNLDQQGETKSAAPEIRKLPRSECAACGLTGPTAMVYNGRCVNLIACARRQAKT